MECVSVFDIFKVGIGPSSSHTMGPWLAADSCRDSLTGQDVQSITVKLFGSLASTGKGHGTDVAIILGLEGHDARTINISRLDEYVARVRRERCLQLEDGSTIPFNPDVDIEFIVENPFDHPNALSFEALLSTGERINETYLSIGGGFLARLNRDISNPKGVELPYPIQSGKDLLNWTRKTGLPIPEVVLENELSWRSKATIMEELDALWEVMRHCMYRGCGTVGTLPGGLNVNRRAGRISAELLRGIGSSDADEWMRLIKISRVSFVNVIKWVSCFALAVTEENASFGRVVTAPTNGAAGVIPAVLMYLLCFGDNIESDSDYVHKFLLTAGEIGSIFKKGATISGAMGGCQAEIGVSSAMAAAGLTACLNGSPEQILMAAEIAMEHHLGLTCDPVGGLVQVPCIERNTMGAIKAITASHIALSSEAFMAKVSLDSVIKTMKETAADMQSKYKETAEGGLAIQIPVNVSEC